MLFELELALPNKELNEQALRLIGFEKRYDRIRRLPRLYRSRELTRFCLDKVSDYLEMK